MSTQHRWKPIMDILFTVTIGVALKLPPMLGLDSSHISRKKAMDSQNLQRAHRIRTEFKPSSTYIARVCPPLDFRGKLNSSLWFLHNFNTKQASKALQIHLCQSTTNCGPRELHMPAADRPLPFLLLLLLVLMSHPMPSIPSGTQLFQKVCQQRQGQQPG